MPTVQYKNLRKKFQTGLTFLKIVPLSVLSLFACSSPMEKKEPEKPNIVLILADDMGYSDIGCYGGEINTPNLDQLALEGIRFSQFYNAARCCPTRASLLTGLYPHETGFGFMDGNLGVPGYEGYLNDKCMTIAEVLKTANYETMMTGKWHLGDEPSHQPIQRGFDRFYGTLMGAGSYFDPASLMVDNTPVEANSPGYYYTDAISDTAVSFIQTHTERKTENPFFLYVSYTAPHWPLHAPEEAIEKYKGVYSKGWDSIRSERYERMVEMGLIKPDWKLSPGDSSIVAWDDEEHKKWRERSMEVYAAQVEIMDQGIGRIVSVLEKSGELENTLILFLSDNGGCAVELKNTDWLAKSGALPAQAPDGSPMRPNSNPAIMPGAADTYAAYGLPWANVSNTPFRRYKSETHEGGTATPFIAYWPSAIKKKNIIVDRPAHIVDVMSTCIEAAGINYPEFYREEKLNPLQGISLLPIFKGNEQPSHEILFWEHVGRKAVMQGKWKLVSLNRVDWELYDLEKDRTELNDLSEKYPEKVRELEKMYLEWAEQYGVLPYEEFVKARQRSN